jgi:hypothetical protein
LEAAVEEIVLLNLNRNLFLNKNAPEMNGVFLYKETLLSD